MSPRTTRTDLARTGRSRCGGSGGRASAWRRPGRSARCPTPHRTSACLRSRRSRRAWPCLAVQRRSGTRDRLGWLCHPGSSARRSSTPAAAPHPDWGTRRRELSEAQTPARPAEHCTRSAAACPAPSRSQLSAEEHFSSAVLAAVAAGVSGRPGVEKSPSDREILRSRCRLFWNQTCTCRGSTLSCLANSLRVSRPLGGKRGGGCWFAWGWAMDLDTPAAATPATARMFPKWACRHPLTWKWIQRIDMVEHLQRGAANLPPQGLAGPLLVRH
eukprot:scaffold11320_cov121-Isochrysis_galbana.AAC.9